MKTFEIKDKLASSCWDDSETDLPPYLMPMLKHFSFVRLAVVETDCSGMFCHLSLHFSFLHFLKWNLKYFVTYMLPGRNKD